MIPLVPLAAVAAAAISTAYTVAIAREAKRPRRSTYAWALAHGLAPSPAEVPGVQAWHEGSTTIDPTFDHTARASITHDAGSDASLAQASAFSRSAPPSARSIVLPWWIIEGRGSGTMLVIHGWGRSRWDSLRRVPWLLDHAASIVLPDLRGHGEAPGTTSIGHSDHLDLDQVLVDALGRPITASNAAGRSRDRTPQQATAEHQDPRALTLVGHSMGAMVAARFAAMLAERGTPVRRLVLMAPYDSLIVPMANRLRVRGLPAGAFAATAAWWLARGEEPLHRTLRRVRCPVFALGGGIDAVTTPSDVRRALAPHEAFSEADIDHAKVGVDGVASREALDAFLKTT